MITAPKKKIPRTYAVVVNSMDSGASRDSVKAKVVSEVAPKIGDIRVKAVRRTKTGVEIETVTRDERERLQVIPAFNEAGLSVVRARRWRTVCQATGS